MVLKTYVAPFCALPMGGAMGTGASRSIDTSMLAG